MKSLCIPEQQPPARSTSTGDAPRADRKGPKNAGSLGLRLTSLNSTPANAKAASRWVRQSRVTLRANSAMRRLRSLYEQNDVDAALLSARIPTLTMF